MVDEEVVRTLQAIECWEQAISGYATKEELKGKIQNIWFKQVIKNE